MFVVHIARKYQAGCARMPRQTLTMSKICHLVETLTVVTWAVGRHTAAMLFQSHGAPLPWLRCLNWAAANDDDVLMASGTIGGPCSSGC
jgi:hypothetical protein